MISSPWAEGLCDPGGRMDDRDSGAIQKFLIAVGGLLMAGGTAPMTAAIINGTNYRIARALIVFSIGLAILLCGLFWHRLKPQTETKFTTILARIASDPRWWAAIIFGTWLYMAVTTTISGIQRNNEIVGLRNDQQSITEVLNRFVLPRQLDDDHGRDLVFLLRNAPQLQVTYEVAQGDEEASSYRADIQRALDKAGWHLKNGSSINYVVDPPTSLGVRFEMAPSQEGTATRPDPKLERADVALRDAFAMSGVLVNTFQGSGDGNATGVIITIGHRRRDAYALPCTPK
jgi:hypothetical protein